MIISHLDQHLLCASSRSGVSASGIRVIFIEVHFFSRYLSFSESYPFELRGLGDPTESNATASLALRVTGKHKALHY
jgi:hypothetical protein